MSLVIFSHSEYFYLWNIIEESILNLQDLNPIFISNSNSNLEKPKGFKKYIEYEDNLCYAKRWINILQTLDIDLEYLLVVHDINIIADCNVDKIKQLLNICNENNIDRCSLNVFDGKNIINSNIPICKLEQNIRSKTFIPYDLCPAIWRKKAFLNLWETFPNETYRDSELNNNLQMYCNKLNCYGLQKTNNKIYYCIGRPYYEFFKILHITIKGELLFPYEVYMDLLPYFITIKDKYNLTNKIKINNSYGFILINLTYI
jgi:hypothetical protein